MQQHEVFEEAGQFNVWMIIISYWPVKVYLYSAALSL